MPTIYDIAGAIKPAQPMSAIQQAMQSKAQRRLMEAQALTMETNVANNDRDYALEDRKVKVSEAGVGIAQERNQIDAAEFGLKYDQWRDKLYSGMSEDDKRAFDFFEKAQETGVELYEQALAQGASEEEAMQMANAPFAMMQRQMPQNMRGQALFDPNLGTAIRSRNNRSTKPQPTSFQRVVTLPGQEPQEMEVWRDGEQMYIEKGGKKIPLQSDWVSTPDQRVRTGVLNSEKAELRAAEYNTKNYIDTVADAIKLLDTVPDANTATGRLAGIVNDLQTEAMSFAKQFGFRIEAGALDPTSFSDDATIDGVKYEGFDSLGIKNAQMKSLITNLAFQKALASAQSGRDVSNSDVQRFITEIGANHADPRAFKQVLKDTAHRMDRNFRNRYKILDEEGKEYTGSFGLERLEAKTETVQTPNGNVTIEWLY